MNINGATGSTSGSLGASGGATIASGMMQDAKAGTPATQVLDKKRLQELVKEVDPNEQLDEDVEDLLMHIADDFIEQTVTSACALARHRKANSIEVKDVQYVLERNWNMWIPGFGADDLRSLKRPATSEAHKSRMALIRKALKKY